MQDQSAILMSLGELKGQMSAIQQYLNVQGDRLTRHEERIALAEKTANERVDGLAKAVDEKLGAVYELVRLNDDKALKANTDQSARISRIELRISMYLGGAMVVLFVLKAAFDAYLKLGVH